MRYLFAFRNVEICHLLQRGLKKERIVSEIRTAHEFPDGMQGPELWVRDEDFDKARQIVEGLLRER